MEVEEECLKAYDEGKSRPFQAVIDELRKEIEHDPKQEKLGPQR